MAIVLLWLFRKGVCLTCLAFSYIRILFNGLLYLVMDAAICLFFIGIFYKDYIAMINYLVTTFG
jgi:hypothetical protein